MKTRRKWLWWDLRPYEMFDPEPFFSYLYKVSTGAIIARVDTAVERRYRRAAIKDGLITGKETRYQRSERLAWAKCHRYLRLLYHHGWINGYRLTAAGDIFINIFNGYKPKERQPTQFMGRVYALHNHVDRIEYSEISIQERRNDKRLQSLDDPYENYRNVLIAHIDTSVRCEINPVMFRPGIVEENARRRLEMKVAYVQAMKKESENGGVDAGVWNGYIYTRNYNIHAVWEPLQAKLDRIRERKKVVLKPKRRRK